MEAAGGDQTQPVPDRTAIGHKARTKEIIKACRLVAGQFLTQILQRVFSALDEDTAEKSGKIRDEAERAKFFEGLRRVQHDKEAIEKVFHAAFTRYFSAFLQFTADRTSSPPGGTPTPPEGLSLVNDTQLEESLAADNLIAKMHEHYSDKLYGLEHRLIELVPDARIEPDRIPMGPENICWAFRDAVEKIEIDIKLKLFVYKLFDRAAMMEAGDFFDEANQLLIDNGVLPQLKMQVKRIAGAARQPQRTPREGALGATAAGASGGQSGAPPMPIHEQMFQAMKHLLIAHSGHSSAAEESIEDASLPRIPVTPLLVDSLSELQHDSSLAEHTEDLLGGGLKQQVIGYFANLKREGRPRHINQIDDETIDVISMIFDYILDDRSLPDFIKALIGRLQIPVLKVAIIDREFFSKKSHPARQLLNELAHAGLEWSEESEAVRDRLYQKMESIVMRILHDFESDVAIFSELLEEFRGFVAEEQKSFAVAQEKVIEAVQEAEQREKTKKAVAEEIAARLVGRSVPEEVQGFLLEPWRKVLTEITLQEGPDSAQHAQAVKVIDDLLWSIEPKKKADERKRLIALLPSMLTALREGLRRIEHDPQAFDEFTAALERYHSASVKGGGAAARDQAKPDGGVEPRGRAAPETGIDAIDRMLQELDGVDGLPAVDMDDLANLDSLFDGRKPVGEGTFEKMMAEMGFESDIDEGPRVDDEYTALVKGLELGTWVELTDEGGGKGRVKLAWKGDEYTNYSFMNRQFKIVAERPLYVLAEEFRTGAAVVVEDVALFDRAMDGVISGILRFGK